MNWVSQLKYKKVVARMLMLGFLHVNGKVLMKDDYWLHLTHGESLDMLCVITSASAIYHHMSCQVKLPL